MARARARERDARAIGQVVFNNLNQMFIEVVKVDEMSRVALKAAVARQNADLARRLTISDLDVKDDPGAARRL